MNKEKVIIKSLLGATLIGVLAGVGMIWTHHTEIIAMDNKIDMQFTINQNNYDEAWGKFTDDAHLDAMEAEGVSTEYQNIVCGNYDDTSTFMDKIKEGATPKLTKDDIDKINADIFNAHVTFVNDQKYISDMIDQYNNMVDGYYMTSVLFGHENKNLDDFGNLSSDLVSKSLS